MQKIAGLILTTFNQLELTKQALKSLKAATNYPTELVVVDNNSQDNTIEYLKTIECQFIQNNNAIHLTVALNQGIRKLLLNPNVAYLGWIHNDMIFYPGWLESLLEILNSSPDIGKISPHNWQGEVSEYNNELSQQFMEQNKHIILPGNQCPWLMPRRVIEEVGFFDEGFIQCGGYEDWDYNNRLLENGYKVMITYASVVWHKSMGTREHIEQSSACRFNAEYYEVKWGPGPRV